MTNTYEKMKKDLLWARKNKVEEIKNLLTYLISEITAVAKDDGSRAVTEEDTQLVIKRFIKKQKKLITKIEKKSGPEAAIKIIEIEISMVEKYQEKKDESQ